MAAFLHDGCGMTRSKVCFKCNAEKDLGDFYRHPRMADGHLNKCKGCTKNDAGNHRLANLDRIRAYDRLRSQDATRRAKAAVISSIWSSSDPRITVCHNAVARAVRSGALIKQPCSRCGHSRGVAHHESYDRPLDVTWLCQPCHKARHKEMDAAGISPY